MPGIGVAIFIKNDSVSYNFNIKPGTESSSRLYSSTRILIQVTRTTHAFKQEKKPHIIITSYVLNTIIILTSEIPAVYFMTGASGSNSTVSVALVLRLCNYTDSMHIHPISELAACLQSLQLCITRGGACHESKLTNCL